jgi:acyl dehydratase
VSEQPVVTAASDHRSQGTLRTAIEGDRSLDEAQRLVGYDHRGARTTIEVTADNTRDYCNYIDSINPLYTDPAYGKRSRWGRPLAPPSMVGTAIIAPGLRGVQWIYGGTRWRFPGLYGPGDMLSQTGTLVGADLKHGRNASNMIVQNGFTRCVNQHGQTVVETEVFCMRIPRKRSAGGLKYEKREVRWSRDELDGFGERIERERTALRGAVPRYWDDMVEGEPMDEILFGPLRLSDIALTRGTIITGMVGGKEKDGGFGYMLDHYRRHPADSYVNPDTGVTEHPHRGHWEQYMAEEVGMPGIYDIGYQRLGWLCRYITDWMGDDARLLMLEGALRKPVIVGDLTLISGTVAHKKIVDGRAIIYCKLVGKNQNGEETIVGKAEIELLARVTRMGHGAPDADTKAEAVS